MAFNDTSKINISLKKLSGKAHTSNDKGLANEGLPSGITSAAGTIFGEAVPSSPTTTNLYDRSGTGDFQVELVRLETEFITGTDTSAGRHAFKLKLPSGYEDGSSHGPAGAYVDDAVLYSSNGALQLVPTSFGTAYEAKPFYGGSATKNSGTQIPVLDARDWTIDYYNGVLFQQDPPGTGDHANNPDFVEAFLYIGKYLDTVVSAGSSTPAGANTQIQYNNAGSFGASSAFTFTGTEVELHASSPKYTLRRSAQSEDSSLSFEGQGGVVGSAISHEGLTNDLVLKTYNGSSTEEILRLGSYYNSSKRQVIFLSGSGMHVGAMQPRQATDINFFVSGSINSRGTSTKGTAVFGGDMFVSGTIHGISSTHILVSDDSNLTNARVMTAGDGITISTATPRQITISSTGLVSRSKRYFDVTGSHVAENVFSCSPVDFSNTSYSPDRIDVYLNGQHLRSGSANDYSLYSDTEIKFRHDLFHGDAVLVITF